MAVPRPDLFKEMVWLHFLMIMELLFPYEVVAVVSDFSVYVANNRHRLFDAQATHPKTPFPANHFHFQGLEMKIVGNDYFHNFLSSKAVFSLRSWVLGRLGSRDGHRLDHNFI